MARGGAAWLSLAQTTGPASRGLQTATPAAVVCRRQTAPTPPTPCWKLVAVSVSCLCNSHTTLVTHNNTLHTTQEAKRLTIAAANCRRDVRLQSLFTVFSLLLLLPLLLPLLLLPLRCRARSDGTAPPQTHVQRPLNAPETQLGSRDSQHADSDSGDSQQKQLWRHSTKTAVVTAAKISFKIPPKSSETAPNTRQNRHITAGAALHHRVVKSSTQTHVVGFIFWFSCSCTLLCVSAFAECCRVVFIRPLIFPTFSA